MEAAHTYVTADTFRANVTKRKTKDVTITGLGVVKVQKLKLGEFDELEKLAVPAGSEEIDQHLFARLMILAAIIEPQLPADDVEMFDEMDADMYTDLVREVRAVHSMGVEAHDEIVARFPDEGLGGDEISDADSGG